MKIKLNINATLEALLKQEDTDNDKRITIEDVGSKKFVLKCLHTNTEIVVEGTFHLSNLLQELVLADQNNSDNIDTKNIFEKPVARFKRMIETYYWVGLTRTIDKKGIEKILEDDKSTSEKKRIYVPDSDTKAFSYFKKLEKSIPNFEVIKLPKIITPEYVLSINSKPGILSLKLEESNGKVSGVPFVVPGGRFNEMYGWDSYFESIGLLLGKKANLAKNMADNFQYEIQHYGKILNANRTYYLTRTQPPFYSSLIREVYESKNIKTNLNWLESHLKTAIKEYESVWMVPGKRLTEIGLNRYLAEGIGMPPEVEKGHYNALFNSYAKKLNISITEFEEAYSNRKIDNPVLDNYFIHDRTVRENGHDTSYRLENKCAHLVCVELNTFLYKYEADFAYLIKKYFNDNFSINDKKYDSEYWALKKEKRENLMQKYLWNEQNSTFYDYDFIEQKQVVFDSATSLTPLWAKIPTSEQAKKMIEHFLPKLTMLGGILGSTEESRGNISENRPARQWDFPNGWAPHQIMVWKGLLNYGYNDIAQQLIYRWLWMITINAVNYNGTIPEKYNVVTATHKVFAEYGNVGTDFEYITKEGFGWMNASYIYGLQLLSHNLKNELNQLSHPDTLFKL